mmetsp:Transcript_9655/g.14368  ORF Transcript_9655/g.14368 Transcript_9655/m.14368 type:complete len:894 (+) Transcript_9655:218-2899(+)
MSSSHLNDSNRYDHERAANLSDLASNLGNLSLQAPPGFVNGNNAGSAVDNTAGQVVDGAGGAGAPGKRSKSFKNLAEFVGEGLAESMDDFDFSHNNQHMFRTSSANDDTNLLSALHNSNRGPVSGELNNFQRQSRHAANRLIGKTNYSSLEHQYDQHLTSNATTSHLSHGANFLDRTPQTRGSAGPGDSSQHSYSSAGGGANGGVTGTSLLRSNSNNLSSSSSLKLRTGSHLLGLKVDEPAFMGAGAKQQHTNQNMNMDAGILAYMQSRDSGRLSGTGSAPPDVDKIFVQQHEHTHPNNQTTESQLMPYLRSPDNPLTKPSRCLAILLNCKPGLSKTIRNVCESFGGLEYFRSEFISRGVIFLSYFNLIHAQTAAVHLPAHLLSHTLMEPRVRYCSEINGVDETRLLISSAENEYGDIYANSARDLPLDEGILTQILSTYGKIRHLNYQVFPGGQECFAVEFYDVMDAKQALLELQSTSHPNLPPIKIQVGSLSPKERKLARELLQLISQWRSGGTGNDVVAGVNTVSARRTSHSSMTHQMTNHNAIPNSRQSSRPNSRAHSPSVVSMQAYGVPTPPRTPPPILLQQNHLMAQQNSPSMHSTATGFSSLGGTTAGQPQQQAHLIVAPNGQYNYVMCTTDPYGHAQQVYFDQPVQPGVAASAPQNIYGHTAPPNLYYGGNSSPHNRSPQMSPYVSPGTSPHTMHSYMHQAMPPIDSSVTDSSKSSDYPPSRAGKSFSTTTMTGDDCKLQLNLQAIQSGQDKRTSLMVRNIPNKYTQQMMLNELRENGYDSQKIDFFYLPIDFKNKCNRGYAFVNFVDYVDIVPFWEHYHGRHWRMFNSDKICDITYARIQGKAAMLKRFEHSALMDKDEDYRPLVFVSSGPNKGKREAFPNEHH